MKQLLLIFFGGLLTMTSVVPTLAQNVGVGTTAPTQKLDVNGNLRIRGLSGTDNRLPIVQPDGTVGISQPIPAVTVLTSPVNLGAVTVSSPAGAAIGGNYLYVSHNSPNELLVFDISNATSPVAVPAGTVVGGSGLDLLTVANGYVYVCELNGITVRVYSLLPSTTPAGSPTAPAFLGTITAGANPDGVAVIGTNLFVANYGNNNVQVFNLTGPGGSLTNPPSLGTFATGAGPADLKGSPDGRYLYVTNYNIATLQVFDLNTGVTTPTLTTTLTTGNGPNALAVANNLLYLTNANSNTLYTYGLSTPATPAFQSSTPTAGTPYGFDVKGNYAYLTNTSSNQVRVLQLTQSNSLGFNSSGQLTSVPNSALGDNLGSGVATTNVNLNGNYLVGGTLGSPGTSGVFVAQSGRVGIGTTVPFSNLANTASNIVGSDGNGGNPGSLAWLANQSGYAGQFYNAAITAAADGLVVKVASTTSAALDVSQQAAVGTAGTALFRVNANGNVGIGVGTPAARLDVQGGADANGANDQVALGFSYRTGGFRHFLRSRHNSTITSTGNDLDFYLNTSTTAAGSTLPGTGNVQVLTLESNNSLPRVGIGTSTPTVTLHVAGTAATPNVRLESLGGTGSRLVAADASGNLSATATLPDGTTFIQNQSAADQTGSLRITGNGLVGGNVGIGSTATPGARLDVANGDVRVAAANDYTYASAKTYSLMLGASDFQAENGTTPKLLNGTSDEMYPASGATPVFRAPMRLPQGAIITGIALLVRDNNASSNLSAELVSYQASSAALSARTTIATVTTAGTPNYTSVISGTLATIIDNDNNTYSLRATFDAAGVTSLTLRGVKVTYTVLRAQ